MFMPINLELKILKRPKKMQSAKFIVTFLNISQFKMGLKKNKCKVCLRKESGL